MPSLWDATYIVTDVETTGSDPSGHRIIEVACVVVRGGEIAERVHSLINPHQFIPPFIEQLTGISNTDVAGAPEEYTVVPLVAQLLTQPNAVFVAHQEQFDWRFLEQAMHRCRIAVPNVPHVCTLRLARRLLPSEIKKNLDALAAFFGIEIKGRHRAFGDAEATARVLLHLLDDIEQRGITTVENLLSFQYQRLPHRRLPVRVLNAITPTLDALPRLPGVYAMYDAADTVLYVGKAKVLSERVRSYFQPGAALSPHIEKMLRKVRRVEWEETPTELSALLLESQRIKQWQPPFNVLHRRMRQYPFLRLTDERFPRLELVSEHDGRGEYFGPFPHRGMADQIRSVLEELFILRRCSGTIEPSPSARPCFYYHLRRCGAPCASLQTEQEYAEEIEKVRGILHGNTDWLIARLGESMYAAADRLDFEHAERLRVQIEQLRKLAYRPSSHSTSLTNFNAILVVPTAYEAGTAELFVFVRGKLVVQRVVGRRSPLDWMMPYLEQLCAPDSSVELTPAEISTLRIVTSWMYHNQDTYRWVTLDSHDDSNTIVRRLQGMLSGRSVDSQVSYVPIEDI
ncbi:MAG: exonuclease domain-containing protein [Chlorobi bacterium]|nr:exonuclease domain-containing protein [Chlorobiota bacterium]